MQQITPEEARKELERRKAQSNNQQLQITPEDARKELERRNSYKNDPDILAKKKGITRHGSIGRGLAQGASWGFSDEIQAYIETLGDKTEGARNQKLQEIRENLELSKKAYPFATGAGEFAGAAATIIPAIVAGTVGAPVTATGGAIAVGSKVLPRVLPKAIPKVLAGFNSIKNPIVKAGLNAVPAGVASGGIYSAGINNGGVMDKVKAVPSGALVGGLGAFGFGGLGAGVKQLLKPKNQYTKQTNRIINEIIPDQKNITEYANKPLSERLGNGTNQETVSLYREVADQVPDVTNEIQKAIKQTKPDLLNKLNNAYPNKTRQSATNQFEEQIIQRRVNAQQNYSAVQNKLLPKESQKAINDILSTDGNLITKAKKNAIKNLSDRKVIAGADELPAIETAIKSLQNESDLNYLAVDAVLQQIGKQEAKKGNQIATATRNKMLDKLKDSDENIPYLDARKAYSEASQVLDNFNIGKEVFDKKLSIEQFTKKYGKNTPEQKEVAQIAFLNTLENKMQGLVGNSNPSKFLNDDLIRSKVKVIFGDETAEAIFKEFDAQNQLYQNLQKVNPNTNSATYSKLIKGKQINPDNVSKLLDGDIGRGVVSTFLKPISDAVNRNRSKQAKITVEELAAILYGQPLKQKQANNVLDKTYNPILVRDLVEEYQQKGNNQ